VLTAIYWRRKAKCELCASVGLEQFEERGSGIALACGPSSTNARSKQRGEGKPLKTKQSGVAKGRPRPKKGMPPGSDTKQMEADLRARGFKGEIDRMTPEQAWQHLPEELGPGPGISAQAIPLLKAGTADSKSSGMSPSGG
jgi:hypothetical protein